MTWLFAPDRTLRQILRLGRSWQNINERRLSSLPKLMCLLIGNNRSTSQCLGNRRSIVIHAVVGSFVRCRGSSAQTGEDKRRLPNRFHCVAFIDLPTTLVWFDDAGQHIESLESERPVGEQLLIQFHRAVTSLVRSRTDMHDAFRALHIVQRSAQSFHDGVRFDLQ